MRTIFAAMITVFIPIYMLSLNTPILYIPVFYIIKALVGIVLLFAVWKISIKYGLSTPIIFSSLAYVLFLLSIRMFPIDLYTITILAIESELADVFFWIPFHQIFLATTHRKIREKEIDTINALISAAPLISPLIAAFIIVYLGYGTLFAIAGVGILISIIPMLFIKNLKEPDGYDYSFKLSKEYFAEGVRVDPLEVYWPLFIFLVLGSVESLGIILIVSSIVGAISLVTIGHVDNEKTQGVLLKIGGILHSLTILVRGFLNNFYHILGIMVGATITNSMLISPYLTRYYNSFEKDATELGKREVNVRIGRIFSGVLLFFLIYHMPGILPFIVFMVLISPTSLIMGWKK
ncbi:MAG: hypothetical protein ACPL0A_03625 [Candidatus Micrarchaeia archaeon]